MKLIKIDDKLYNDYKVDLIFDCYKWDPQFMDSNTISNYILVITKDEHEEIKKLTEQLEIETDSIENFLNNNLHLTKKLQLDKKLTKEIKSMSNYNKEKHIRLTRYDFHPTTSGEFLISEINSDVPGGFAEASLMPKKALELLNNDLYSYIDFSSYFLNNFKRIVNANSYVAIVHCTCYSDDRQVMQFLGDKLKENNYNIIYCSIDHLRFKNNTTTCILNGNEVKVDAIIRFTPLEWIKDVKPKHFSGLFNTFTTSCNHPISIFMQTKRLPLIWDTLSEHNIKYDTYKKLLNETLEVDFKKYNDSYIFKPSLGRVGEKISIKEACIDNEYNEILKDVKKNKKSYIMQKKFISKPIITDDNKSFHLCLGSFGLNGKHAGYYARISNTPRIDSNACDIPVLIEGVNSDE